MPGGGDRVISRVAGAVGAGGGVGGGVLSCPVLSCPLVVLALWGSLSG